MSSLYVNQMSNKLNRKSVRSISTRIDNVRLICAQAVGFRPCIDIHKVGEEELRGHTKRVLSIQMLHCRLFAYNYREKSSRLWDLHCRI
jgi:hypothetical protein